MTHWEALAFYKRQHFHDASSCKRNSPYDRNGYKTFIFLQPQFWHHYSFLETSQILSCFIFMVVKLSICDMCIPRRLSILVCILFTSPLGHAIPTELTAGRESKLLPRFALYLKSETITALSSNVSRFFTSFFSVLELSVSTWTFHQKDCGLVWVFCSGSPKHSIPLFTETCSTAQYIKFFNRICQAWEVLLRL